MAKELISANSIDKLLNLAYNHIDTPYRHATNVSIREDSIMQIQGKGFTIKQIDESYAGQVLEVYKQCEDFLSLGPVPNASMQMVLDDFKLSRDEGGTFCGIYIEGEMAGIVDFNPSGFEGNPECAYIALLMISFKHRKKGVGTAIVKSVENEIRKKASIRTIRAGVQVNNPPAIAFWAKMGYEIISGPEVMPDTTVAYQLRKIIRD
jgi:ribosomal protein S18 acetylase RimI-like enzyme